MHITIIITIGHHPRLHHCLVHSPVVFLVCIILQLLFLTNQYGNDFISMIGYTFVEITPTLKVVINYRDITGGTYDETFPCELFLINYERILIKQIKEANKRQRQRQRESLDDMLHDIQNKTLNMETDLKVAKIVFETGIRYMTIILNRLRSAQLAISKYTVHKINQILRITQDALNLIHSRNPNSTKSMHDALLGLDTQIKNLNDAIVVPPASARGRGGGANKTRSNCKSKSRRTTQKITKQKQKQKQIHKW